MRLFGDGVTLHNRSGYTGAVIGTVILNRSDDCDMVELGGMKVKEKFIHKAKYKQR